MKYFSRARNSSVSFTVTLYLHTHHSFWSALVYLLRVALRRNRVVGFSLKQMILCMGFCLFIHAFMHPSILLSPTSMPLSFALCNVLCTAVDSNIPKAVSLHTIKLVEPWEITELRVLQYSFPRMNTSLPLGLPQIKWVSGHQIRNCLVNIV